MEGDRVSSFNHFFAVFVAVIMFNLLIYLILRQYFFKMTFLSFGLATCMIQCNISCKRLLFAILFMSVSQ